MAGGGGKSESSSSTIPKWARRSHMSNLARATTESYQPYEAYTGQRVASDSPVATQARDTIGTLASGTNTNITSGVDTTGRAITAADNLQNLNLGAYAEFTPEMATKYMSPYQQAVTDVAKRTTISDYQKNNILRDSDIVSRGAFGGSRHAIIQSEADKQLAQQLSDLQVAGQQDAYTRAQQQFGEDRTALMDAFNINTDVDNQRLNAYLSGGRQLADIGQSIYGNQQQTNQTLYDMGKDAEAKEQAGLDVAYEDYLTARDWSKNQLSWLNNMHNGTAGSFTGYTGEAPHSSNAVNLLGLGATALGAMQ